MEGRKDVGGLIDSGSIREYFHVSINSAFHRNGVEARTDTRAYIVNVLTFFNNSAHLFGNDRGRRDIRPLAMLYADAVYAETTSERYSALRQLGDTALFISGIFPDSLPRKAVGIDYYVGMGRSAYSAAAESVTQLPSVAAAKAVFGELCDKFVAVVDVLNDVSARSNLASNTDVLRLYESWLKTGSRYAARRLRALGVEPLSGHSRRRH